MSSPLAHYHPVGQQPYKIHNTQGVSTYNIFYLFSPAGWDNEKKVAILYENMHSIRPDQYYTDVIAKPIVRKSTNNRDIEVTAEDEQGFLLRQQQYLQVKFSFETLSFKP